MLTQAGQDVFHPEVVPGLLGGGKLADLKPKSWVYGKKLQNGSTFVGCFLFFFLPSVTEGRNSFQRDFF